MNFEKTQNYDSVEEKVQGICLSSQCKKGCNGATGNAVSKVTSKINSGS